MTSDEFTATLAALRWKQSDLARRLDLDKNTPSRWANGRTPVPQWAAEYLGAMLAIERLHAAFVRPRRAEADGIAGEPAEASAASGGPAADG